MDRDEIHALRDQLQVMLGAFETGNREMFLAAVRKQQLLLDLAQARAETVAALNKKEAIAIRSLLGGGG